MNTSYWRNKIMDLVAVHKLGFHINPGGGQFTSCTNPLVHIQVPLYDEEQDYNILLQHLQKLDLES